jgi:hypothetical protein
MELPQPQPQPRPPPYMRTTLSCQYCQGRKIRCDRKILGSPCTNCRLDGIECLLGVRKSQKRASRASNPGDTRTQSASDAPSQGTTADLLGLGDPSDQRPMTVDAGLPGFVKALPAHLTAEDTEYLRHRGIFQIPATGCRNEILRAHFQFVHPLMPLLDIESFIGPMLQSSPPEKISLLLLYAVLCSGAAHVEIGVLHALGYQSRKAARKAFFDRARVGTLAGVVDSC